mmetsp:Transcript_11157/g.12232  ORF Transcript_11157/g.12232 Transcript_11157/m.12232 type:complete len:298 (-) Transcript_11157:186-1079(-)
MGKLTIDEQAKLKKVSFISLGVALVLTIVINCILAGASDPVFWGVGWIGVVLSLLVFGGILYLLFRCDDMGNPCCHLSLAIMLLFSFGPIFFGVHYGIFHPFTSADWSSGKCTLGRIGQLGTPEQEISFAKEDYYPLEFEIEGKGTGCGCSSERARYMTIDASPYPYVLKNNKFEGAPPTGGSTSPTKGYQQTLLPSWTCTDKKTKDMTVGTTYSCLYRLVGDKDKAKVAVCPAKWDGDYYEVSLTDESGHSYYPVGDMVVNVIFDYTGFLLAVVYLFFAGIKAVPALRVKEKRRIE